MAKEHGTRHARGGLRCTCRVDHLLNGRKHRLPAHQRPTALAAAAGRQRAGAPCTDVTPQRLLQPTMSNASDISVRYSLAEHYLSVLTPIADGLLIGAESALATPGLLSQHNITHVIILCRGPEVLHSSTRSMLLCDSTQAFLSDNSPASPPYILHQLPADELLPMLI